MVWIKLQVYDGPAVEIDTCKGASNSDHTLGTVMVRLVTWLDRNTCEGTSNRGHMFQMRSHAVTLTAHLGTITVLNCI